MEVKFIMSDFFGYIVSERIQLNIVILEREKVDNNFKYTVIETMDILNEDDLKNLIIKLKDLAGLNHEKSIFAMTPIIGKLTDKEKDNGFFINAEKAQEKKSRIHLV